MFGAIDNNDLIVLIKNENCFEALLVTNQDKQKKSYIKALKMIEVGKFKNEASEQDQRFVEKNMFLVANSNDSTMLIERWDNSEALPLTIQEKQKETSAEPLMIEVASFENEASEQEQRFVKADSNDLNVLRERVETP